MLDPLSIPPVDDDEVVCRFAFSRSEVSENRVHWSAFKIRERDKGFSVMRQREADEADLIREGQKVGDLRNKSLIGWADLLAANILALDLELHPRLEHDNPNHADVLGYPDKKESRDKLAMKLADTAIRPVIVRGNS
ncbi:MAG TPA: hypothetical protein VGN57_08460 [Pirellulaceae bacterium]|jgi:hypothetical protein|nr:hypothetical protein [Pirellulaceae bacterium]